MKELPETENTPLVRTDFSDANAWMALKKLIAAPNADGFQAYVKIIDDAAFDGATFDDATLKLVKNALVIVADRVTLDDPDYPFLCIHTASSDTLRVIARELWAIENNLSIANMDFDEFVKAAGPDGVFRGF
jgi:hypothetical protein